MKAEYGYTKFQLEKILDSEFKTILNNIESKSLKVNNLIYIGKIKPTSWFVKHEKAKRENKGDNSGMD